jgi:ribosomal protein L11 methyltransferase
MAWQELTFQTRSIEAESIAQLLNNHGALAVTMQDAGDQPIYEPELGTLPLWDETLVTGLFETDDNLQPLIHLVTQTFPQVQHQLKKLADQDWERTWMQDFQPMQFGNRLWIIPSFEAHSNNPHHVILDPGLAFGTGKHPTTALCLQWLDQHIQGGETVIDYGCGSGILGIAALKLGARQVIAIDHDPQAMLATRENAARNNVSEQALLTFLPTDFNPIQADILVANILAKPLIEFAPYFAQLVAPKGHIILSGILKEQTSDVIAAYQNQFEIVKVTELNEWVRIEAIKKR